jgi:hypothetical protein
MSGEDRAPSGSGDGATATSLYAELRPPPELASHACCVWTQVAGPSGHVQRVLPDGCADIVWMAGGELVVAGPATGHVLAEIPPGVTAVGVRFGPGAAGAALGQPAYELQDRTVELADLWGAAGRELTERMALTSPLQRMGLLADAVARRLRDARAPDPVVTRAAVLLAGGMPVARPDARSRWASVTCAGASTTRWATDPRRCSGSCACAASSTSSRPCRSPTSGARPSRSGTPISLI